MYPESDLRFDYLVPTTVEVRRHHDGVTKKFQDFAHSIPDLVPTTPELMRYLELAAMHAHAAVARERHVHTLQD